MKIKPPWLTVCDECLEEPEACTCEELLETEDELRQVPGVQNRQLMPIEKL